MIKQYRNGKTKNTHLKKISILMLLFLVFCTGVGVIGLYQYDKVQEAKREEERILAQQREKEEKELERLEEQKRPMSGVNHNGRKYAYDARIVQRKLDNCDYSNNGEKVVFLTFDDGPSTTITPKIIKTLEEYDVNATFFVTGDVIDKGGQPARDILKESFDKGNAIGNHSYTHDYKHLYPNRKLNIDNFKEDFARNDKLLKEVLGDNFSTNVIRCPGGYMSWQDMKPLDDHLDDNDIASIDWNALNADSEGKKKNADELVQYAIETSQNKEMVVILMHDTYGKDETAKALPRIIEYYKEQGYKFKVLA